MLPRCIAPYPIYRHALPPTPLQQMVFLWTQKVAIVCFKTAHRVSWNPSRCNYLWRTYVGYSDRFSTILPLRVGDPFLQETQSIDETINKWECIYLIVHGTFIKCSHSLCQRMRIWQLSTAWKHYAWKYGSMEARTFYRNTRGFWWSMLCIAVNQIHQRFDILSYNCLMGHAWMPKSWKISSFNPVIPEASPTYLESTAVSFPISDRPQYKYRETWKTNKHALLNWLQG